MTPKAMLDLCARENYEPLTRTFRANLQGLFYNPPTSLLRTLQHPKDVAHLVNHIAANHAHIQRTGICPHIPIKGQIPCEMADSF
jgi:hypothetical protein